MPRWTKHKFSVDKVFYESSIKPNIGHTVDVSIDMAHVELVCTKCAVRVTVLRNYPDVFIQPQKGEALRPHAEELYATPNCRKWQTIRTVMES